MNTTKLEITLPAELGVSLLDLYYTNPEVKARCDALGVTISPVIPAELGKEVEVEVSGGAPGKVGLGHVGSYFNESEVPDNQHWISMNSGLKGIVGALGEVVESQKPLQYDSYEINGKKSQKPATAKQLKYLSALGWKGDVPSTQSEASKLITNIKMGKEFIAVNNAINPDLPTQKQLNYLNSLGWKGEIPLTKKDASALIDRLKLGQKKAADVSHFFKEENESFFDELMAESQAEYIDDEEK
jgi:hypothetical protein